MAAVTLRAFAKINLSLRIKAARTDGFHDVETVLQSIDLFDRVTCAVRRGPFEIRCTTPGVPLDRTNLVWKAAHRLWREAGREGEPRDAAVTLEKAIPMQAGLGGGSSDAAAALKGLRRAWNLRVADSRLFAIAAGLGSDVPYFLVGGTALALGRGEQVYPLEDLPRLHVVLILPPFGVATRDAYAWLDERRKREPVSENLGEEDRRPRVLAPLLYAALGNDLEAPVLERHPVIGQLKQRLSDKGAIIAAMSGSGSTVFGVFTSAGPARTALRSVQKQGVRAIAARFLKRRRPASLPVSPSID
jgi:4-diphosphocytidyl-2-C-methyl-D-erythritol kinase